MGTAVPGAGVAVPEGLALALMQGPEEAMRARDVLGVDLLALEQSCAESSDAGALHARATGRVSPPVHSASDGVSGDLFHSVVKPTTPISPGRDNAADTDSSAARA